jgi:FkbM family methyltransferase
MKKYSQGNEDEFLVNYFIGRKGKVVEIGAADGTLNSNSLRLIEEGWEAILVEPNFNNYSKIITLHENNKLVIVENCGCSNVTKTETLYIDNESSYQQLSTFNPKQVQKCKDMYNCEFEESEVNVIKTSELFEKYNIKKIEFLSIDTESFDLNVILGIDFDVVDIELICVEDEEVSDLIISKGYNLIYRTSNLIFKKV